MNTAPTPPVPTDEAARLEALRRFSILDTETEECFDRITRLASSLTEMPIALISFVDDSRQWFKSRVGVEAKETPRDVAFCAYAIMERKTCLVPNALEDRRFSTNPLVRGEPHIRFYAGAPLVTSDGFAIGTLCVIDTVPHDDFSAKQQQDLQDLAHMVMDELELRLSNRSKADFVAMISHEIRTPMNGVLGMASLLRETDLSVQQQETLDIIINSAQMLLQILNDVLDLSKLEASQLKLEMIPCDFRQIATASIRLLESMARRKKLKIQLEAPDVMPCLNSDPVRLQQILSNLISNAIKFTPNGTITVKLDPRPLDAATTEWTVSVSDTGIGIAPENLSKLFKPYSQAESSTLRRFGGTGLGLSITKQLVERLGGTIGVTSTLNEGSTFRLSFPAINCLKNCPVTPKANVPANTPHRPLHILVAEDNITNQLVITAMLAKLGHSSVLAQNGREALTLIEEDAFDLVLMDIEMPDMNGISATKAIRALDAPKNSLPVIALTGHATQEHLETIHACGMIAFLTKPLHLTDLQKTLDEVTGNLVPHSNLNALTPSCQASSVTGG